MYHIKITTTFSYNQRYYWHLPKYISSCTKISLNLILNNIDHALDTGLYTYLILFDLSSDFDTLNHDIITLLYDIVIHGQVHAWFMPFISNSRSFIRINYIIIILLLFTLTWSFSSLDSWTSLFYHLPHPFSTYLAIPRSTTSINYHLNANYLQIISYLLHLIPYFI